MGRRPCLAQRPEATGALDKFVTQKPNQMYPSIILRSGRSAWKGPFFVSFPNVREALINNTPIKTDARSCTILPHFVGIRFLVHNGKDYIPVTITQDMVGHKLGEFSHTKKRFVYKHTKNK